MGNVEQDLLDFFHIYSGFKSINYLNDDTGLLFRICSIWSTTSLSSVTSDAPALTAICSGLEAPMIVEEISGNLNGPASPNWHKGITKKSAISINFSHCSLLVSMTPSVTKWAFDDLLPSGMPLMYFPE